MREKLKIKISIADRVYQLTIDYAQEEALTAAYKKIDLMIKQFEENYAVRYRQDVLAMCALQFASQVEQNKSETFTVSEETKDKLTHIDELLTEYLNRS